MIKKETDTNYILVSLFIIIFFLSALTGIQSCNKNPTDINTPKITTTPTFDTLQGKWIHLMTTYAPVNPALPPYSNFTILNSRDTLEFRSDLTGKDHFPQTYPYVTENFTYNLLPDDSTLIFNTGSVGNPVYDTVIILDIKANYLNFRSKAKTITTFPPNMNGTFYVHSILLR